MGIQLVLGSSGTGKSYQVYTNIIKESVKYDKNKYIVIVPEQFTMQTQKEIVSMHPRHGTFNIDIVSFQRLAFRIFDEQNFIPHAVLEDVGKSMVIRKIIEENQTALNVFGTNKNKPGFIEEVKSLLSEFYQYQIGEKEIDELLKKIDKDTMVYQKLTDIKTICHGFEDFMKDHFIVAEQLLEVLAHKLSESDIIKESTICIDGFTGFTPVQYQLLGKLFRYAKNVIITVTIDHRSWQDYTIKDHELFQLSKRTIAKIKEIAKEEEVELLEDIVLKDRVPYRFKGHEELAWLEKNLFRFPYQVYEKVPEHITMHLTRNPKEEAAFVARKIRTMVMEEGFRYRDFAVVTGDMEGYYQELEMAMDKLRIPYFVDHNTSILNNPFIESLRALLELIDGDFSYEQVFRYLKADMSSLEQEEADLLENYVLAAGIRGYSRWKKPFTRNLRRLSEVQLERINDLRVQVLEEINTVRTILKNKKSTVRDFVTALYYFMEELEFEEKLEARKVEFEEMGEFALAKAYDQVYASVLELMDKTVDILGEDKMPLKEFNGIFDAGLSDSSLGVIPPGIDQVVIGDIERTRLKKIKVMFFVGVNDGIIPKTDGKPGIITDIERETLKREQVNLAPTSKEHAFVQQFYLYWNLTKPEHRLYISLSKVDSNGKSLRPSYLSGKLQKIFPKLKIIDEDLSEKCYERIYTPADSVDFLIDGLHNYLEGRDDPVWNELYCFFKEHEEGQALIRELLDGAFYQNQESPLNQAIAKALYGKMLSNSATRLEKYAACAFAHFLRYGLELEERQEYMVRSVDMGNVFHKTIELFSKELEKSNWDWRTIENESRDLLVEECVKTAVEDCDSELFHSSARNQYMIATMNRIAKRTVWALQEHVKRGDFNPSAFELSFQNYKNLNSTTVSLDDDVTMVLKGKIDRIDTYEDEDYIYLKIIDYKSGSTAFDVVDLYYGLQIQLIVYMNAAIEVTEHKSGGKTVIPAGVFYYNMKDPLVEAGSRDEVDASLLKDLRMNGLANADEVILNHLESDEEERFVSIPVTPLKKGGFSKRSKIASTAQLEELSLYVSKKVKEIGKEIIDGNISITPYTLGSRTACDYCEYHSVCGFDPSVSGSSYRRLKNLSQDDVWELIQKNKEKEVE